MNGLSPLNFEIFIRPTSLDNNPEEQTLDEKIKKFISTKEIELATDPESWKQLSNEERFTKVRLISEELPTIARNLVQGRFNDVRCPFLTHLSVNDKPLHANHIYFGEDLHVICAQAPVQDKTEALFWRAVMQTTNHIIDLTNSTDYGKGVTPYFPKDSSEIYSKDCIEVKILTEEKIEEKVDSDEEKPFLKYVKTTYKISDGFKKRRITRLNYVAWPDHGALPPTEFEELIQRVHGCQGQQQEHQPPFIHCRAGVGRTGTLAVGMAALQMIKKEQITSENYLDKIDLLILAGRYQRGKLFVQTKDQYESILLLVKAKLNIS